MARNRSSIADRRGLAPLELVLVLPLLILMLVIIVDAGSAATWRVRSLGVAREAVFRTRWPRGGPHLSVKSWSSDTSSLGTPEADPIEEMDFEQIQKKVVRNPPNFNQPGLDVIGWVLDPKRGVLKGNAKRTEDMPLPPEFYKLKFDSNFEVIDDPWTFARLYYVLPPSLADQELPSWEWRPIHRIYEMERFPDLENAYNATVDAAEHAARGVPGILPLERENDWPRLLGIRWLDFHIRARFLPTLDTSKMRDSVIDPLVVLIQGDETGNKHGVPENMANEYINHYKKAIEQAGEGPQADQLKRELDPKIKELEKFLDDL